MDQEHSARRYFSCSTLNGRLYVNHVSTSDGGSRLGYWTAEDVQKVYDHERGDRLIHSIEELEETLRTSADRPVPLRLLFLAEGLRRRSKPTR